MRVDSLLLLIWRELKRTRGALVTAGVGIALGIGALVFFLALGLGVRAALLGDLFPLDEVELEPRQRSAGLLGFVTGHRTPPGISDRVVERLRGAPGVIEAYPKLRLRVPGSAYGGAHIIGKDVGTEEIIGDGIDPALVAEEGLDSFVDPLTDPGPTCLNDRQCPQDHYCERPSSSVQGECSRPVPVLVSRYLVELFDHSVAPAHGFPPLASIFEYGARGLTFRMGLGRSMLGQAPQGRPRTVPLRLVGVSPKAIDIGLTLPLSVVQRWNREYAGAKSANHYSSVVVRVERASDLASVVALAEREGLRARDNGAREVSLLINAVTALLSLVAGAILLVAGLNIAHTFRLLVANRQREIGLYRAVGASRAAIQLWLLTLAVVVGTIAATFGVIVARLAAALVDWRAAIDLPDFPFKPEHFFAFPAWLWLLGIGFAILFTLLGALGPILSVGRIEPAEALARG